MDLAADQCSFTLGGQQAKTKDAKRLLLGGDSCRKILYFAEDNVSSDKGERLRIANPPPSAEIFLAKNLPRP